MIEQAIADVKMVSKKILVPLTSCVSDQNCANWDYCVRAFRDSLQWIPEKDLNVILNSVSGLTVSRKCTNHVFTNLKRKTPFYSPQLKPLPPPT